MENNSDQINNNGAQGELNGNRKKERIRLDIKSKCERNIDETKLASRKDTFENLPSF